MAAGCSPALLPAAPAPAASRRDSPGSSRSGRERSERRQLRFCPAGCLGERRQAFVFLSEQTFKAAVRASSL